MAKWSPHMTRKQRRKYNEYMRKRHLRRELERGRVPQPIKPANWLLALYREFGLEDAIYIPQEWMDDKIVKEIRAKKGKIRKAVRDSLPANATREQVNSAVREVSSRMVYKKFMSS